MEIPIFTVFSRTSLSGLKEWGQPQWGRGGGGSAQEPWGTGLRMQGFRQHLTVTSWSAAHISQPSLHQKPRCNWYDFNFNVIAMVSDRPDKLGIEARKGQKRQIPITAHSCPIAHIFS
jgi:hypothetical protein